ncbi:hypothetical protein BDF22DRAFT_161677 [Syncephalis plumigaleata]|nr:hypothetical protein BDF22DRAFT_161677 [Syncephalis plumigaleata]
MEPHTTTTTTDDNPVAIALLTKELEQLQLENDNFRLQNQNLKEQTAKLLDDANHDQKCIAGLQQSLEEAETEREHLEEQLYAHQQENDSLRQEVQVVARRQREAEKLHQKEASICERGRTALLLLLPFLLPLTNNELQVKMIEKERAVWMEKEVSYQEQLQTLQRQLHRALETQQEQQARTRQMIDDHETTSPLLDAQQRELNTARKNIREQDKLIMELREQIEQDHKSAIRLNEQYEAQAIRITILDNEIKQLKNMNQSLQEDNESYQILLQERTMNGDFMLRSISEGSQHERPTTYYYYY